MENVPIVRTSERRDFLRCQIRWWWTWREGLEPAGLVPDALWFGTGIHIALAKWYCGPGVKRGPHPAETWDEWARDEIRAIRIDSVNPLTEEDERHYVEAAELGRVMLDGYVNLYGRDEHKLIIAPEKTFRIRVPWPKDQGLYPDWTPHDFQDFSPPDSGGPEDECALCDVRRGEHLLATLFDYVGTFDSTWRHADTGLIMLDEHKTAASIATGHLSLDAQAGSYWAVAARSLRDEGLISSKDRIAGIEYNFLRKALPDDRPRDREGYATNAPVKADYIDAIEAERARILGPRGQLTGREKLPELRDIAAKLGLTVLGERSKRQPAPNYHREIVWRTKPERVTQLIRLQHEGLHMAAIRDGVLPVLKNPDRSCNQGAFRCPHFEMCELHETGADLTDFKRHAYRVRDPYADHRTEV